MLPSFQRAYSGRIGIWSTARLHQRIAGSAASPQAKAGPKSRGRIHRIDEPTEPAKLLAVEAVNTNDATLIALDEQ
jgi:hypothetical protein